MIYFLVTIFLLSLSIFLTHKIRFLSIYRIPPSLIAGASVLLLFTFSTNARDSAYFLSLKELPSIFIAFVFACLFLQKPPNDGISRNLSKIVFAQTALVWVSIMGQVIIALLATIFIYRPFFQLPIVFTSILETGFAGGHGTAVAMGPILQLNGLPSGLDFGLFSATVGLICGTLGGIGLIHRRRKHIDYEKAVDDPKPINISFETLAITLGLIALAYLSGSAIKALIENIFLSSLQLPEIARKIQIPLFVYTLVTGYLVRKIIQWTKHDHLISTGIIMVLGDFFLEILIFAGIATINVLLIESALFPLMTLFTLGFLWNLFCHRFLLPKFLPIQYHFDIGLINFGMLNGTTATGLMLLKMYDPHYRTPAAKVYAQSAALTQPLIGGGLLTLATPYILNAVSANIAVLFFSLLFGFWFLVGIYFSRKIKSAK